MTKATVHFFAVFKAPRRKEGFVLLGWCRFLSVSLVDAGISTLHHMADEEDVTEGLGRIGWESSTDPPTGVPLDLEGSFGLFLGFIIKPNPLKVRPKQQAGDCKAQRRKEDAVGAPQGTIGNCKSSQHQPQSSAKSMFFFRGRGLN